MHNKVLKEKNLTRTHSFIVAKNPTVEHERL